MQQLVDAIRSAGAEQPILIGGLDYSGDLSQWLSHEPTDDVVPSQLAASFHDYDSGVCQGAACLAGLDAVQSVAARVPVVTGEFGYLDSDNQICTGHDSTDFANEYMNWADQHGISYLARVLVDHADALGRHDGRQLCQRPQQPGLNLLRAPDQR